MRFLVVNQTASLFTDDGGFFTRTDLTEKEIHQLQAAALVENMEIIHTIMGVTLPPEELPKPLVEKNGAVYVSEYPISCPEAWVNAYVAGDEKYREALLNFWRLAALNPDPEARDNLFWFLEKYSFKITPSGYFLAYRNVQSTKERGVYTDEYTRKFRIMLGTPVTMPRDECDGNQSRTCSNGLHVAGQEWLKHSTFGNTGVVCLINPMNVVAVPPSDGYGKMRVCEYLPIQTIEYDSEGNVIPPTDMNFFEYAYSKYTVKELEEMVTKATINDGKMKVLYSNVVSDMWDLSGVIGEAKDAIAKRVVDGSAKYKG